MMPLQTPAILFVCTANRFRSPIAQAAFARQLKEKGAAVDWIVESAGSWTTAGMPPYPSAAWMQAHLGLDLSGHTSQPISRDMILRYHLILVMEKNQKEALRAEFPEAGDKVFLLTEMRPGAIHDIPDPVTQPESELLAVAQEIIAIIDDYFDEICRRALENAA